MQQQIMDYQETDIKRLETLLSQAIQTRPDIVINVSPHAEATASPHISQTQHVTLNNNLPQIQSSLNELKEEVVEEYKKEIDALKETLRGLENRQDQKEIKESSAMSKLKRFLKDVEDSEKQAGKMIKGVKDGVSIAQDLAGYYNDIAQWCGLPIVPQPFLKRKG